jgi:hypothetical protein
MNLANRAFPEKPLADNAGKGENLLPLLPRQK